ASVVIKTSLLMREQPSQRWSAISPVRSAVGLESVNTDVFRRTHVPARLGPDRLDMAIIALGLAAKEAVSALGREVIETVVRGIRRGERQLVKVQSGQFRGDLVVVRIQLRVHVGKPVRDCKWKLVD